MNGLKMLTIFAKSFIADVRLGSKYASDWEGAINVRYRWTAFAWNLQPQTGT